MLVHLHLQSQDRLLCDARAEHLQAGEQGLGGQGVGRAEEVAVEEGLGCVRLAVSADTWVSGPPVAPQPGHPVLSGKDAMQDPEQVIRQVARQAT